jgi:hypothetical protein
MRDRALSFRTSRGLCGYDSVDAHVVVATCLIEQGDNVAPVTVGPNVPAWFLRGHTPHIVCKQLNCFHRVGKKSQANCLKTSGSPVGVRFKGVSCAMRLVLPVEQLTRAKETAPRKAPFLMLLGIV